MPQSPNCQLLNYQLPLRYTQGFFHPDTSPFKATKHMRIWLALKSVYQEWRKKNLIMIILHEWDDSVQYISYPVLVPT